MPELDKFFGALHQHGGSDLHLSAGTPPALRLHGSIVPLKIPPLPAEQIREMLEEVMPQRARRQFSETGDADFSYDLPGVARFRGNAFLDRHGPGAVFRIVPTELLTADQLGLPSSILKFCTLNKGLVLVTGPTGSGKSTTLAAMINHINETRKDHIITIEDPIEFVHENNKCRINQREVHDHTQSFAIALRAALREDPDIVLVGEMRDLETTHIAIETAETGHLVLGTLHTSTAASTVDRIIDQFPADRQAQIRTMLSVSLKGVISQALCRRKDGQGRIAAMEVLVATSAIANHIREGKTYQIPSAMQTGAKEGMLILNDSLIKLVMDDRVTAQEAFDKSVDRKDMAQKLQIAGIDLETLAVTE